MRELIASYTKKDFKIDWFSGTGKGGQHRNKHQNCCRITLISTGKTFVGQRNRDRKANFRDAFKKMAEYIRAMHKVNKSRGTNEETIRTYHEPDNRVKDHASGLEMRYDDVLKDISPMINARKMEIQDNDQETEIGTKSGEMAS